MGTLKRWRYCAGQDRSLPIVGGSYAKRKESIMLDTCDRSVVVFVRGVVEGMKSSLGEITTGAPKDGGDLPEAEKSR